MRHSIGTASALVLLATSSLGAQQVRWTRMSPGVQPTPRGGAAVAYDTLRQRVVLFGGDDMANAPCCVLGDTWEWDGAMWTLRQPTHRPTARAGAAMAFDPIRGRMVLFGGSDQVASYYNDTWEWDGTDWMWRPSANVPSARQAPAMTWDAARGAIVLFGGWSSGFVSDTWVWDGVDWQARASVPSPSGRADHVLVYDAAAREVVLFGGWNGAELGDTWIWNGTQWSARAPAQSPGPRRHAAGAYFESRGRTVLFGGSNQGRFSSDTWEWTGNSWELRGPGASPSARAVAAMAYDAARDRVILFGGLGAYTTGGALGETWVYAGLPAAAYGLFGAGCAGSAGTPALTVDAAGAALPWIGTTFVLRLSNLPAAPWNVPVLAFGASRTSWPPFALPLSLAPIKMPGCTLLVSLDLVQPLVNAGGTAIATLVIPAGIGVGGAFYNQGFVLDAAANPFGMTVSNGGAGVVGLR